jgi:hypothetical protein
MRVEDSKVRDRAYQIWEREGRPEGATQSHWKQAYAELQAEAEHADNEDSPHVGTGGVESGVAQPMPKP